MEAPGLHGVEHNLVEAVAMLFTRLAAVTSPAAFTFTSTTISRCESGSSLRSVTGGFGAKTGKLDPRSARRCRRPEPRQPLPLLV